MTTEPQVHSILRIISPLIQNTAYGRQTVRALHRASMEQEFTEAGYIARYVQEWFDVSGTWNYKLSDTVLNPVQERNWSARITHDGGIVTLCQRR